MQGETAKGRQGNQKRGDMTAQWVPEVFQTLLDNGIGQVAYVPDAGLAALIEMAQAEPRVTAVALSSEQEGVALLAGAWLGGQRGALLMQSSGVGTCINLLSLTQTCRFPLLMVVTMRGQWGEANPWQVPMGSTAKAVLEQAGLVVFEVAEADRVAETVAAAATMVFNGPRAAAVLISQRIVGAKTFTAAATVTGQPR